MGVNGGMKAVYSVCTYSISLDVPDHKECSSLHCMSVYHSIRNL